MRTFRTAFPYFPEEDIENILNDFREILEGKEMLTMGKYVSSFETKFADFCGCRYAVSTNSCSSALEISLNILDLKKEDEVIVPVQTFVATGSCVVRAGATPVFCDTDDNFLINFEDLKSKITEKTKAVIVVHYAGLISENILKIRDYLKERNIIFIEDAAHAHGAYFKKNKAGSIGDMGCFSFFSTKIMTTGEGGMITTNNSKFYKFASSMRSIGIDLDSKSQIFSNIGSNNRLSEFQSILGLYQLKRLDEFVSHRNSIASIYKEELKELIFSSKIRLQKFDDKTTKHPYWRFIVFLNDNINRNNVLTKMKENNIIVDAPYIPLLHQQPALKKYCSYKIQNAEKLNKCHISLPVHLKINCEDAYFIANTLKGILND